MKPTVIKYVFNSFNTSTYLYQLLPNIKVFYFINENKVVFTVIIQLFITRRGDIFICN